MLLTREDHAFVPPAHAIGHRFASIVCRSGPQTSYLARSLDLAAIVDVFQTVINIQNLVTLRKWLADAEGRGADATITEEQRALILAVACEPPEKKRLSPYTLDESAVGCRGHQTRHRRIHIACLDMEFFKISTI